MEENTLKDTYSIRLRQLKGVSYDDYLKSKRWASIKRRIKKDPNNRVCAKCKSKKKLNLHHLTYKNLNTENDHLDIIVFCEVCHKTIHDISNQKDLSVLKATRIFLKSKINKSKLLKKKRPKKPSVTIKYPEVGPDTAAGKAAIAHELNNQKLLDNLNKYKNYFSENNSKPKSRRVWKRVR